jgi:hypothetical protein
MRGGKRPGAGRPKGAPNRRTTELRELAERGMRNALAAEMSPVDVMLARMRGDQSISHEQFEAACAAAPYVCPRLSAVAVREIPNEAQLTPAQRQRRIEVLHRKLGMQRTIEGVVDTTD